MSEKRFVTLLIVGALIVLTAIVLGVRPNTPPIQPFGSALKTMPASRHVTGMPYPKLCTLTVSNGHALPDHGCTPGAADGEVIVPALGNPGNLAGTICTPGWTKAAAALDGELVPVKAAADAAYNMRGQSVLVWLVPLSLGGSNDVSNLFPLSVVDTNAKANVDATLNKAVCAGTVGLAGPQTALATNWTTALNQLGIGGS